jgi:hypothetical protein
MIDERNGAFGGVRIVKGNLCIWRNPPPVPFCPSQEFFLDLILQTSTNLNFLVPIFK